jgi:hypothetical protein
VIILINYAPVGFLKQSAEVITQKIK